ncbi:HD domain-containing phosphohydrolase [Aminipila luticellarii]|uniref:Diguanylate cyclase n=1 Tax=Aminipila luticellarii TaxID=2507160 RepID=A0A410PVJ6_9FIRM|nr:HD domain-containing phosphohydrolase [Aminipila luticellarii]QAT42953.1 diguanylate cyclase [Aminipila luticellarii]
MSWMKKSIIRIIGVTISLFIFLLFFVYLNFLDVQLRNYFEQQAKEELVKDSQNISAQIEIFLQKYVVIADQAKNNPDFIRFAREVKTRETKRKNPLYDQVTKELEDISDMDKNIDLSYIALPDTKGLISSAYGYDAPADVILSEREWYIKTMGEKKTTVTAPYQDLFSGKLALTVAVPLQDNGNILGAFSLDILIEDIHEMMRDYRIGEKGYAVLIYDTGQIIDHPDMDTTNLSEKVFVQDWLGGLSHKILSGKNGIASYTDQGEKQFIAYLPIPNTHMTVLTIIPESEVFSRLNRFLNTNLCIVIGLIVIMIFLLLFFKHYISTPVVRICREIENFSNHNKIISLPPEYLFREDEIGILSNGLTFMLKKITDNFYEIEQKNRELSEAKEKISRERSLFKTTLQSLGDGVISTDKYGRISLMNRAAEELTGWSVEEARGEIFQKVFPLVHELSGKECDCPAAQVLRLGRAVELEEYTLLIQKTGHRLAIEDSAAPVKDEHGNLIGAVIVFRDFTEKKQKQEQILYLSYHDQLTGLYNRRFFEEELQRLDKDSNIPFSIAMIDVNGLKLTNDAFGHTMGDKLLKRVARVLKEGCRGEDVVARIGGDEFIILLPHTEQEETEERVKQIYKTIEQEKLGDIIISVSIGCAVKSNADMSLDEVIIKAEEQMYMKKITESQSMRHKTIQAIVNTLNEKNERERIHSEKVSEISKEIGQKMNLDGETVKELETAGLMHDIGKIIISEEILNKPGKLTESEYQEMKRHPECGYQILRSVNAYSSLAENVLYHHERWDGNGYPRGLKGEEIPLLSRIIAIADSFEAMTAKRPYKEAMTVEASVHELIKNSGTQFDPQIVQVFVEKVLTYPADLK